VTATLLGAPSKYTPPNLARRLSLGLAVNLLLVALLLLAPFPAPAPRIPVSQRSTVTLIAPASLTLPKPLPVLARSLPRPVPVSPRVEIPVGPTPPAPAAAPVSVPPPPAPPPASLATTPALPAPAPQPVVGTFSSPTLPEPKTRLRQAVEFTELDHAASANPAKSRQLAANAGFDAILSDAKPRNRASMAESGFGSVSESVARNSRPTPLAAAAFEATVVPKSPSRNPPPTRDDGFQPLEILSKPKPQYTAVARQLGIEGEVVLKVRFAAEGRIEVLQTLSGLGYGLDDNAALAAAQIQFRPAYRAGKPIDQIANLRILFQLAQ